MNQTITHCVCMHKHVHSDSKVTYTLRLSVHSIAHAERKKNVITFNQITTYQKIQS